MRWEARLAPSIISLLWAFILRNFNEKNSLHCFDIFYYHKRYCGSSLRNKKIERHAS